MSVLLTVKNDPIGCATVLSSLAAQTRTPNEIIVVDGGSTDETIRIVQRYANTLPQLRLIEAPGANIARGRNIGTAAARHEIIATTDAGCRADTTWLNNLVKPFEDDPQTEFVAGCYRVTPRTLIEEVVGALTMRGQGAPIDPQRFNPSARSMAYTKPLWSHVGGWPEWIQYSEDTLWDHKMRRIGANWKFAEDATVEWRPRSSLREITRQFYHYGTGRGHTQLEASNFTYNLRNLALVIMAGLLCISTLWAVPMFAALLGYFYVWSFHSKAVDVARRTGRRTAYPLAIGLGWLVMVARTAGYLVGTWQRWRHADRYRMPTDAYLGGMANAE